MNDAHLFLYPNPGNGQLFISTNTPTITDHTSIEILDLQGRIMYRQRIRTMAEPIDISGLAAGTYIARLSGLGKVYRGKVLVR